MELDRTNLRLIELLQRDGRMSITDLAHAVQRAESTVRERLVSLERHGVIKGFRAVVDMEKLGFTTHAFLQADCRLGSVSELGRRLEAIPNIVRATLTTGPKPLILEVWTSNLAQLENILEKRIAPLELERIESRLVVQRLVEPRTLTSPNGPIITEAPPVAAIPEGRTIFERPSTPNPSP